MQTKHFFTANRWLVAIVLLTALSISNVWGTTYTWTLPWATTTGQKESDDSSDAKVALYNSSGTVNGGAYTTRTGVGSHISVPGSGYFLIRVPISSSTTSFSISAEIYGWKSSAYAAKSISVVYYSSKSASTTDLCSGATTTSGCYSISQSKSLTSTYTEDNGTLYIKISPEAGNIGFESLSVTVNSASCGSATPSATGTASLNGSFNMTSTTSAIGVASGTWGPGTNCSWSDYGFVWSDGATTTTPTVSNNKVQVGYSGSATSWTGSVTPSGSTTPTSWTTGHTYYVRAYGKNNNGSATYAYGSAWSFTPYLVTFNKNDGGATTSTQYVQGGVSTALTSNSFSRTGYNFNGWNTDADGTSGTGYTNGQSVSLSANLTLYAKWTAKTTTVSFNQNSGTGGQTGTLTATYDAAMPSAPVTCPTRDGYDFGGYYDGSGGSGTQYYTNTGASAKNWDKEDATYTLYAKWTIKSYSVTWKVDGTNYTTGEPSSSVNHGSHISTLPTAPSPASYCGNKFMGWTDATDGAYVHGTSGLYKTADEFPTASGAQIFYAVFADYGE